MIRIILVDDHELVREGVSRLLEAHPDMHVVGSFGDGGQAVRFAAQEAPDVAVVDIAMPQESGIDIARRLREASPETHILVLSMHTNPEYVHQALLAGALGYVAKESAGPVLVKAIHSVCEGRRFLSESLGDEGLERFLKSAEMQNGLSLLTPRERQVLQYTVAGLTIAETAERLGLSPKSVATYRSRTMSKLAVDDIPALVKYAIRRGITTLE
jgi:DNA-binding NarL/FixJ family response regulator